MTPSTALRTTLALLPLLAGSPALAQTTPAAPADGGPRRELDGHAFITSVLARSPFPVTEFQVNLLYGSGSATGPAYGTGGLLGRDATYTFAAMAQTFAYEYAFDGHFSAALGAVTQLYSGIDGPSALVVGAEIEAGLFGRFTGARRVGPVQLAATLDAAYAPRFGIKVIDAVLQAIEDGTIDDDPALDTANVWTLRPGVAAAWAPIPALGLTASLDVQWLSLGEESASRENGAAVDLGLVGDLDLSTFTKVPVAVFLAYRATLPLDPDGITRVWDFSAGVFYVGRPGLTLGFETGHRTLEVDGLAADAAIAQIRFQYMW